MSKVKVKAEMIEALLTYIRTARYEALDLGSLVRGDDLVDVMRIVDELDSVIRKVERIRKWGQ